MDKCAEVSVIPTEKFGHCTAEALPEASGTGIPGSDRHSLNFNPCLNCAFRWVFVVAEMP